MKSYALMPHQHRDLEPYELLLFNYSCAAQPLLINRFQYGR